MKRIKVLIARDSTLKIEVSGFEGKSCLKETKSLEDALGTVSKRTMTGGEEETEIANKATLS